MEAFNTYLNGIQKLGTAASYSCKQIPDTAECSVSLSHMEHRDSDLPVAVQMSLSGSPRVRILYGEEGGRLRNGDRYLRKPAVVISLSPE